MINADMRNYDYYSYGDLDEYGQPQLIKSESGQPEKQGFIKMAIYTSTQSVQDNTLYLNCQYVGITRDDRINDTFVVDYGGELLKVLYVGKQGRFKRVYLQKVN